MRRVSLRLALLLLSIKIRIMPKKMKSTFMYVKLMNELNVMKSGEKIILAYLMDSTKTNDFFTEFKLFDTLTKYGHSPCDKYIKFRMFQRHINSLEKLGCLTKVGSLYKVSIQVKRMVEGKTVSELCKEYKWIPIRFYLPIHKAASFSDLIVACCRHQTKFVQKKKVNLSEIARFTGVNRKTVRSICEHIENVEARERKKPHLSAVSFG